MGDTAVTKNFAEPPPGFQAPLADAPIAVLQAVDKIRMQQGRALLEAATGGAMPNKYLISDWTHMYQPMRDGQPYGEQLPYPMFYIEEQSGGCCSQDCWCRICCSPGHPALLKFYFSGPPYDPGNCCCCFKRKDTSDKRDDLPAFMTMERFGCCTRFANCWVCCECCQDEMRIHKADLGEDGSSVGSLGTNDLKYRAVQPIGGGGCTPTLEIRQFTAPGQALGGAAIEEDKEKVVAYTQGPTCFGGLYDFCCDTNFKISSTEDMSGDFATISKRKPDNCGCCADNSWCMACCTPADTYDMEMGETGKGASDEMKALMIAEMVHLDFMFFENDKFPIECDVDDNNNVWITILCCLCYCYGALIPIKCCIVIPSKKD